MQLEAFLAAATASRTSPESRAVVFWEIFREWRLTFWEISQEASLSSPSSSSSRNHSQGLATELSSKAPSRDTALPVPRHRSMEVSSSTASSRLRDSMALPSSSNPVSMVPHLKDTLSRVRLRSVVT